LGYTFIGSSPEAAEAEHAAFRRALEQGEARRRAALAQWYAEHPDMTPPRDDEDDE
jgi:hypothetical protein